jgi:polyisoprenoid-binding protein YceI
MPTHPLDDDQSLLYVQVENDAGKLLSRLGHDHVIRATAWKGSIEFDAQKLDATRVHIEVPVKDLEVDAEPMLRKAGLKTGVSDGDRNKTRENMLQKDQLWVDKFPTITFRSTAITEAGPDHLDVRGELTVRGKTLAVRLPMTLSAPDANGGRRIQGRLTTTHGDFGFKPYTAPLGALKNKDALTFVIDVFVP